MGAEADAVMACKRHVTAGASLGQPFARRKRKQIQCNGDLNNGNT